MSSSLIRRYRLPLELTSWVTFAVALTFYWITADPDVSYWDCPEYVTVASLMEVGHPPGNPIWMITMRVATILFPRALHAYVINLCSGLLMAFGVFFLCRIIFITVRFSLYKSKSRNIYSSRINDIIASCISIGASLCFALCDSVWYSAVEAEVYSMSVFIAALSLWIMLLYYLERSKSGSIRLLILVAYMVGLSLGVHQLNLLLIPVFAFIVLYKQKNSKVSPLRFLLCLFVSLLIVGVILIGLLPLLLQGASIIELVSVNKLGLAYNSGIFIFCGLVVLLLFFLFLWLKQARQSGKQNLYLYGTTAIWALSFIILGISSFATIMIRSKAYPFMNEGVPDNIFSLSSYIAREQYPSQPLIYGSTPYSRPLLQEDTTGGGVKYTKYVLKKGRPDFMPVFQGIHHINRSGFLTTTDSIENLKVLNNGRGYFLSDYKFSHELTPELNMWFPRITSQKSADLQAYEDWAGMTPETMDLLSVSNARDVEGNLIIRKDKTGNYLKPTSYRPTYLQQIKFLISYQVYYMYVRYLFWNFIGKQNDFHSNGEIEHGNFITGVSPIDSYLGTTSEMPLEIFKSNKGHNRYYGIPFLIGIIGIIFLATQGHFSRRILWLITLLFLMTGLAIVIYLNQTPGEPRERDYTFLISYMAFSMWIGAGFFTFYLLLRKLKYRKLSFVLCIFISLGTPALMAFENFDDHDRRGRFETTYFASSFLDFEYPSYLFSHGDNSTFPLWYASEVLGMGEKHTPIDITYLSVPSYVNNLKKQRNKGIQLFSDRYNIDFNAYIFTQIPPDSLSRALPLKDALDLLFSSNSETPQFPSSIIQIPKSPGDSILINLHDFSKGSRYLSFRHLMLLDILAASLDNDKSPLLYFPYLIDRAFYKPLEPALRDVVFGKIYSPHFSDSLDNQISRNSLLRELNKLEIMEIKPHYSEPMIASRSARYRGELVLAATQLLKNGDIDIATKTSEIISAKLPYDSLLPDTFTLSDSTFYEGIAYRDFLISLYENTGQNKFRHEAMAIDTLMKRRQADWLKYYHSLTPSQRKALSNRSKRLLK